MPLKFLGGGRSKLRAFADAPESGSLPGKISDTTRTIEPDETLELNLAPSGGYAAVFTAL